MALNKFMHPRNIYKNPPDFAKLATSYEEFSSIAKTDVTGKITLDFKEAKSLRILTKCLLKSDFNLDVVIPEDRLVPTLPLRLNYILWIEDLLNSIEKVDNIWGLDIGSGACAIYPLLAATKNKWHMIGTESDDLSLQKALENVQRNNLQELIDLKKNTTDSIMEFMFKDGLSTKLDFCMCNPPFYSNVQELCDSRSPARLPPKNGFTGSPQELITEGGELTFCRKIIKESKEYKDNVVIFTTMVGHKFTLHELAQDLQAEGVNHTTSEFCQGRVTRWGLAWTYHDYDLAELVPGRNTPRKKIKPVVFLLPEISSIPYDIENISKKIMSILEELKINFKVLNKRGKKLSLEMWTVENTWSNQRRKRRLIKRLQDGDTKKPKLDKTDTIDGTVLDTCRSGEESDNKEKNANKDVLDTQKLVDGTLESSVDSKINSEECKKEGDINQNESIQPQASLTRNSSNSSSNTSIVPGIVVHAFLKLYKKDDDNLLEMDFLDGTAGKEGLHQIIQYIKNNWK